MRCSACSCVLQSLLVSAGHTESMGRIACADKAGLGGRKVWDYRDATTLEPLYLPDAELCYVDRWSKQIQMHFPSQASAFPLACVSVGLRFRWP